MFTLNFKFELNISNLDIHNFLTGINGVEPIQWFITKNGSKNKKAVYAYIVNNTAEYIQLVPVKGNKKKHYIDTQNIAVYHKINDISKISVIYGDINYIEIKIKLKNKTKLVMAAYPWTEDDFHKWSMKKFKNEYKKSSRLAYIKSVAILCAIILILGPCAYTFGFNAVSEIIDQTNYLKNEQKVVEEVAETFEQTKAFINSPKYKDVFSLKIQPFETNAEVSGNTKVVEINSFRFTVDEKAVFHEFDSGDYAYVLGGENTTLGTGYIDTRNRADEVLQRNEAVYGKVKNGTLEKMGYSMKSHYDMTKTKYMIDYFSDDINNFNLYEQITFNYIVSDRISECDDSQKILAVYEKEFDSYYMIVEKVQYNDIAEDVVYNYHIYIYFKNDLNTVETYSITNLNHTEEECFAIINSMELIEK